MVMTAEQLHTLLGARPLRFYDQIGSTNDAARDWLRQGAPDGAVVIADEQVAGRGRQGHRWYTPPGSALAVSVILRPDADTLGRLTMLGALAIVEMVEQVGAVGAGIKWPNDVLVQGRKVSGVLPEAEWHGDRLLGAVLGMGVNVRVDFAGTDVEDRAISLEAAVARPLKRAELAATLLDRVDAWAVRLGSDDFYSAWKSHLLTLGQRVQINDVAGTAEDVDEEGALLVRDETGELKRVIAGDLA